MSLALRFREGLGPQPGGAVALRFGAAGMAPPVVPPSSSLGLALLASWRGGAATSAAAASAWRGAASTQGVTLSRWSAARPAAAGLLAGWGNAAPTSGSPVRLAWAATAPIADQWRAGWRDVLLLRVRLATTWAPGVAASRAALVRWQGAAQRTAAADLRWQGGRAVAVRSVSRHGRSMPAVHPVAAWWRRGAPVVSLGGPWSAPDRSVPPIHPCYTPPAGGAVALRFADALAPTLFLQLRFLCGKRALVRVPVRSVYMVTNTTTLVRVDSGDNIPLDGALSLQLDADSRDFGFSASIKEDALALIEPSSPGAAVELLATINGTACRLIAEAISRDRTFGRVTLRVQGRGRASMLDAPYAALASFNNAGGALTAAQLLEAALPSGWTLDWGLTDWLVPAGVWIHQGTPASAAAAIAAAAGAYLQPHLANKVVRVLARYPAAPWAWSGLTPDLELPASVTEREAIEWAERPRYNGVYVSGTSGSVRYLVKRTGTAADVLAQMVTDPLITQPAAAEQRGLAALANTGRQARVTLRLPVLAETGIILPGKLVSYVDGGITRRGLVRSMSLEAGFPETFQTIGVETHVD